MRMEFDKVGNNFGGFYFLNGVLPSGATTPVANFGTVPNAGLDLHGAVALTFWVRGASGGEQIEFFMGGVGRDPLQGIARYPDSTSRVPSESVVTKLSTKWKKVTIDLTGADLSYVLGGFGWVASAAKNPKGAVFFLDDIQYELGKSLAHRRLNQPRFLVSYQTKPVQSDPFDANTDDDIDVTLRNVAFTYDNALAILSFLADGSADGLRRAEIVGDAFVYAASHDRTFTDGRLRSAYAGGDIALPPGWTPNNRKQTVPIPGFYNEKRQSFYEVEQGSIDTGNNAWAMIALLALYKKTGVTAYLNEARHLGDFINTFRNTSGKYQGFEGGVNNPEAAHPTPRTYASTEHNLDVAAAFKTMYVVTGEAKWRDGMLHAQSFVESMWDESIDTYRAGTTDPNTRNTFAGQLPIDVQAWSILVLPHPIRRHPQILQSAELHQRTISVGFSGFDFNDDKDGVWFEGSAQMAVAYVVANQLNNADPLRAMLRQAHGRRQQATVSPSPRPRTMQSPRALASNTFADFM